jgi:hypothetical protein
MLEYSETVVGREAKSLRGADLISFLSPTDIENVIAVYLQFTGWIVIPGTRRADTPHYEYVLVHSKRGEKAIVQVKSGSTPIRATDFEDETKAFLFAACGDYGEAIPQNVELIAREELENFIRTQPKLLPAAIHTWIKATGWT